ncbi:MAG: cation-transporting P-type ATPase [Desulfobulbaceae bacterium]|uniref:Cation-transporting P-type ATPase n=1 Tax=Candidatus Desulfobia pelagia TaxID=2841692 RepID=A0A8J6NB60_9BACT|nr:cation-transporting P-type ATPase [Candidatus Desulfobia pelagia]
MAKFRPFRSSGVKVTIQIPDTPWMDSGEESVSKLQVDPAKGLSTADIRNRQHVFGHNILQEVKPKSSLTILINQFKNLIVFFLIAAALLSFAFGEHIEGIAIGIVIIINAAIGFVTELKGARSIEALRKLGSVSSRVRRNGRVSEIVANDLVPGDIVILEGGDIITADLRILNASKLQSDESVLTGESLPVGKSVESLPEKTSLAERNNMLFKGTALTRGSGEAVVIATAMQTELGKISSLVAETEEEETPLEKRLNQLGNWLVWVCLFIAVFVVVTGIMAGREMFLMIETGIALAVASIPEGLPIVATIALARGVWRMAKRNALIKELSAVETLGATSIICTDKTGTLTENRLTAVRFALAAGLVDIKGNASGEDEIFVLDGNTPLLPGENKELQHALEVGVLCNNAEYHPQEGAAEKSVGDPLEVALLAIASRAGMSRESLAAQYPEEKETAFDSDIKMMATYHRIESGYRVAVKGAPESVIEACDMLLTGDGDAELTVEGRNEWLRHNEQMATEGLRVLALAEKQTDNLDEQPYASLRLVGLVGLMDPPREDVKEALAQCRDAGIRVIMATGDQAVTAQAIGKAVGLVTDENAQVVHGLDLGKLGDLSEAEKDTIASAHLFARVSPSQKLDLIAFHKERHAIVAMTGDGVNDAPALKKADIGIAMGLRGTQVAREAADMILKDDAFSSIVHAVEQGRIIFKNIRAFVMYLLSCNLSEVMAVTLASFLGMPLPLLPLQILFLNIVTDVFPALALAAGEGNSGIMKYPPRDKHEPIMSPKHWFAVTGYGAMITCAVLGALFISLNIMELPEKESVTISFLTLAFAQIWHVFNMRDRDSGILNNAIVRNPFIWGALALCSVLIMLTLYVPFLSDVLRLAYPGSDGMALVLVMSFLPLLGGQVMHFFAKQ